MAHSLEGIFDLEDNEDFNGAFEAYNDLCKQNRNNYEAWKHFYFFLWLAIEDAPGNFQEEINLRRLMQVMFDEGKKAFADRADFNFIAGYTVSIFPYEYGDYDDLEKEGLLLLLKASQLEPNDPVYKMVYLGSIQNVDKQQYTQAVIDAAPKVLEAFSGTGALNRYFKQILYRLER
jgi:hypothetical protein